MALTSNAFFQQNAIVYTFKISLHNIIIMQNANHVYKAKQDGVHQWTNRRTNTNLEMGLSLKAVNGRTIQGNQHFSDWIYFLVCPLPNLIKQPFQVAVEHKNEISHH